jgi:hypothetical protein
MLDFEVLGTLWLSCGVIPQRWRSRSSGLRASWKRTVGFRSHPILKPTRGHIGKAREFTKRSVDSAIRADSKETGAIWLENSALRDAAFGDMADAKQAAAEGLKLVPASQSVEVEAALAFAMAGDTAQAESLAQDLNKRHPLDTQTQAIWLPAIQAQVALNRKDSASALNSLQAASGIELGQIGFVSNLSCDYAQRSILPGVRILVHS